MPFVWEAVQRINSRSERSLRLTIHRTFTVDCLIVFLVSFFPRFEAVFVERGTLAGHPKIVVSERLDHALE